MYKKIYAAVFIYILVVSSLCSASIGKVKNIFTQGEKAFQQHNYSLASKKFAQAVKLDPDNPRTRFRYGQVLFSLNNYSASLKQFQKVLLKSPNNINARIFLCENMLRLQKAQEAKAHLEWILKVQPGHQKAENLLEQLGNNDFSPKSNDISSSAKFEKEEIPSGFQPLPVKDADNAKINKNTQEREMKSDSLRREKKLAASADNKTLPPEAYESETWQIVDFLQQSSESFLVNLEYARYAIEKDSLKVALKKLKKANKLAKNSQNTRKFLEVQILTGMVHIYKKDFPAFGQQLMKLKNMLSDESYKSFLNIYNQANAIREEAEKNRLAAGIAMGAGHYAVAARLLRQAVEYRPDDILLLNLLAEAQMQNLDYKRAENTLQKIAHINQKNSEAYFNLARFYLTAVYKPEMARKCAEYAKSIKSNDPRLSVILALLDYAEGKIETGVARLEQLLPQLKDKGFKAVCNRIINDGRYADSKRGSEQVDFARIMALPGATHASIDSYGLVAADSLKRGSFFTAMKYFLKARDLAEIGRTYLGLSSALYTGGEKEAAATAAGFGLKALNDELTKTPTHPGANLYLALYYFERNEFTLADNAIKKGLTGMGDRSTRKRLTSLLDTLNKTLNRKF
ncbi:MAG: tetratricopeptide repeat protein [Candidatus Rifleibacteriota bacterium]